MSLSLPRKFTFMRSKYECCVLKAASIAVEVEARRPSFLVLLIVVFDEQVREILIYKAACVCVSE